MKQNEYAIVHYAIWCGQHTTSIKIASKK